MEDGKTKATGFSCVLPSGAELFVGKMTDVVGKEGYAIEIVRESPTPPILPTCKYSYEDGKVRTEIALTGEVLEAITLLRKWIQEEGRIQGIVDGTIGVSWNFIDAGKKD